MSSTRASNACKCCVSAITLEPADAIQLNGRAIHAELARAWARTYGTDCLPDGSGPVPDCLRQTATATAPPLGPVPVPLRTKQQAFLVDEFNGAVTRTLAGGLSASEWAKTFLYLKVLVAWFVIVEPRRSLETFAKTVQLCESIDVADGHTDALVTLLTRALNGMLEDPDNATTIATLDQQRAVAKRYTLVEDSPESTMLRASVFVFSWALAIAIYTIVYYALPAGSVLNSTDGQYVDHARSLLTTAFAYALLSAFLVGSLTTTGCRDLEEQAASFLYGPAPPLPPTLKDSAYQVLSGQYVSG